jgi:RNA polymerase sigma factor (sigma-70 family)
MTGSLIREVRRATLLRDGGGLTDGQLLDCFIERRDEAAFEALVRRHGPMVLGVCRRVLGSVHDAEDAFQATFLVLARKAASLRSRELVGNYLYGVAYRTAQQARATIARRAARERQVEDMPDPHAPPEPPWRELLPRLDQELSHLPDKYRVPVVLCELEGKSRKEVARLLGLPEGTLSWRLARARKLLARRLARYGLALSGTALAAALSERAACAGVTSTLAAATARAAVLAAGGGALTAGVVPARVLALTEGVVKTMLLSKLKAVVAVAFVVCVGAGALGLTFQTGAAQSPPAPKAGRPLADELEELRLEVAALRKGLDATRERVKTLEAEAQARAGGAAAAPGAPDHTTVGRKLNNLWAEKARWSAVTGQPLEWYVELKRDPLSDAEAAVKKLRQNPNDQQAADALERAVQQLKKRSKPEGNKKP